MSEAEFNKALKRGPDAFPAWTQLLSPASERLVRGRARATDRGRML